MEKINLVDGHYNIDYVKYEMDYDLLSKEDIDSCFDFAYDISFNHRGGIYRNNRSDIEVFFDNLRGKLAEVYVYKVLKTSKLLKDEVNFELYEQGKWDTYDLKIDNKSIDVKTLKSYHSTLLIDAEQLFSSYLSGDDKITKKDYYIITRIYPDYIPDKFINIEYSKEELKNEMYKMHFGCHLDGYLNKIDIQTAIYEDNFLKKGNYLNSKELDKDYIYIKDLDFKPMSKFLDEINEVRKEEAYFTKRR